MRAIPVPSRLTDDLPIVRRVIGWAALVLGAYLVVTQLRVIFSKKTGLPDIRVRT